MDMQLMLMNMVEIECYCFLCKNSFPVLQGSSKLFAWSQVIDVWWTVSIISLVLEEDSFLFFIFCYFL